MRKYLHVLGIGIQNTLVYRFNFLFRATFALVPLAGTLFLWRAIYSGKDPGAKVGAFTLAGMVSYYLIVTVIDAVTAVAEDDWQIAADIKDGHISQFLLKPIDYLYYRLCLYLSGRCIYTVVAMLPVVLFSAYLHRYLVFPTEIGTWGWFLFSTLAAGILQFLMAYTMALLAFWVMDVSTFIFMQFAFEYIASGHLFPLSILPPFWQGVIELTPYPYLLYFPASIYLGQSTGTALFRGLAFQLAWIAIAWLVAKWVWSRGIRKYAAAGG